MTQTRKHHPKGLYVLFFSEAWERFSFYGMRALLVLYLVNHLQYERSEALGVYATYLGLVYLTPIIGGRLADVLLGARKAIIIGGILMAIGHLMMAFPSLIFAGMGMIIAGNGFFKPNISTIVGSLYEENDPRRDGGFTIFYMGINLGAMFSPLICGYLGENIGWEYGFSAASIGMILGLGVFVGGQKLLGNAGLPPRISETPDAKLDGKDWRDIVLFVVGSFITVFLILWIWAIIGPIWSSLHWAAKLLIGLVLIGTGCGWTISRESKSNPDRESLTTEEWHQLAVVIIICIFVIFFWMGFEQAGGTMNLFADKQTDRHIGGWEMPASWLQSVNPLYIILLAPLFSWIWSRNDRSKHGIATPAKMGLGMIVLGLGFVIMFFGQQAAERHGTAGIGWLLSVYLLHTIGELCLSPIGLSLVTKLSPKRTVSLMMGLWFAASALADYLAGRLEEIVHAFDLNLWIFLIGSSICSGVLLLLLTPLLKRWMHGKG
ncbi:MAG: peptide MFS transporter [Acidobacteriota bacterium]